MRRPGGYAFLESWRPGTVITDRGSMPQRVPEGLYEWDTFTCAHCNGVRHAPAAKHDTDYFFCRNCMARICPACSHQGCRPFEKLIETVEARDRALRSYGV